MKITTIIEHVCRKLTIPLFVSIFVGLFLLKQSLTDPRTTKRSSNNTYTNQTNTKGQYILPIDFRKCFHFLSINKNCDYVRVENCPDRQENIDFIEIIYKYNKTQAYRLLRRNNMCDFRKLKTSNISNLTTIVLNKKNGSKDFYLDYNISHLVANKICASYVTGSVPSKSIIYGDPLCVPSFESSWSRSFDWIKSNNYSFHVHDDFKFFESLEASRNFANLRLLQFFNLFIFDFIFTPDPNSRSQYQYYNYYELYNGELYNLSLLILFIIMLKEMLYFLLRSFTLEIDNKDSDSDLNQDYNHYFQRKFEKIERRLNSIYLNNIQSIMGNLKYFIISYFVFLLICHFIIFIAFDQNCYIYEAKNINDHIQFELLPYFNSMKKLWIYSIYLFSLIGVSFIIFIYFAFWEEEFNNEIDIQNGYIMFYAGLNLEIDDFFVVKMRILIYKIIFFFKKYLPRPIFLFMFYIPGSFLYFFLYLAYFTFYLVYKILFNFDILIKLILLIYFINFYHLIWLQIDIVFFSKLILVLYAKIGLKLIYNFIDSLNDSIVILLLLRRRNQDISNLLFLPFSDILKNFDSSIFLETIKIVFICLERSLFDMSLLYFVSLTLIFKMFRYCEKKLTKIFSSNKKKKNNKYNENHQLLNNLTQVQTQNQTQTQIETQNHFLDEIQVQSRDLTQNQIQNQTQTQIETQNHFLNEIQVQSRELTQDQTQQNNLSKFKIQIYRFIDWIYKKIYFHPEHIAMFYIIKNKRFNCNCDVKCWNKSLFFNVKTDIDEYISKHASDERILKFKKNIKLLPFFSLRKLFNLNFRSLLFFIFHTIVYTFLGYLVLDKILELIQNSNSKTRNDTTNLVVLAITMLPSSLLILIFFLADYINFVDISILMHLNNLQIYDELIRPNPQIVLRRTLSLK